VLVVDGSENEIDGVATDGTGTVLLPAFGCVGDKSAPKSNVGRAGVAGGAEAAGVGEGAGVPVDAEPGSEN
jgi:hypothetical protein